MTIVSQYTTVKTVDENGDVVFSLMPKDRTAMIEASEYQRTVREKEWQATVIRLAELHGWMVYHTHDSRRSQAGFPDLTLLKPGALVFLELKTEKGRVSAEQQAWISMLNVVSNNVQAYVARPSDWDRIEQLLAT